MRIAAPDQPTVLTLETPTGLARAHVYAPPGRPRGRVALGHGAGPSITTVDLVAARKTLCDNRFSVAVIEQPWLVAGRKVAVRPAALDQAWIPVIEQLSAGIWAEIGGPLLVAGRSAGPRCLPHRDVGRRRRGARAVLPAAPTGKARGEPRRRARRPVCGPACRWQCCRESPTRSALRPSSRHTCPPLGYKGIRACMPSLARTRSRREPLRRVRPR